MSWLQKGMLTMDKNHISQGTHASVLSTNNRQLSWARFLLLALFLAVSLASLQPRASARAADQKAAKSKASTSLNSNASARNCPACQQALLECMGNGGGGECYVQYYACIASCQ